MGAVAVVRAGTDREAPAGRRGRGDERDGHARDGPLSASLTVTASRIGNAAPGVGGDLGGADAGSDLCWLAGEVHEREADRCDGWP